MVRAVKLWILVPKTQIVRGEFMSVFDIMELKKIYPEFL
jgi:hypothetical protein